MWPGSSGASGKATRLVKSKPERPMTLANVAAKVA
jgi:hypothetical protein